MQIVLWLVSLLPLLPYSPPCLPSLNNILHTEAKVIILKIQTWSHCPTFKSSILYCTWINSNSTRDYKATLRLTRDKYGIDSNLHNQQKEKKILDFKKKQNICHTENRQRIKVISAYKLTIKRWQPQRNMDEEIYLGNSQNRFKYLIWQDVQIY